MTTTFTKSVHNFVRSIPAGEVRTYQEVAEAIGKPQAARAVGQVLSRNFDPEIPCHRVIRSDGKVGSYNRGGAKEKRRLLKSEGAI